MNLEFDQVKRDKTLLELGLDFARAFEVFDGLHFIGQDKRMDYEEDRFITVGWLDDDMIALCEIEFANEPIELEAALVASNKVS